MGDIGKNPKPFNEPAPIPMPVIIPIPTKESPVLVPVRSR